MERWSQMDEACKRGVHELLAQPVDYRGNNGYCIAVKGIVCSAQHATSDEALIAYLDNIQEWLDKARAALKVDNDGSK